MRQIRRYLFDLLIKPRYATEDDLRREMILNILLVTSVVLIFLAFCMVARSAIIQGVSYSADSPLYMGAVFLFFAALLLFSRIGFYKAVSYIFIFIYLVVIVRGIYIFGSDEPQSLLGLAMLIIMGGVLVSSRFAFLITALSSFFIIVIGYAQINEWYIVKAYWKNQALVHDNLIVTPLTLSVIAIVTWLSNRDIEKSLARARRSEVDLKNERDSLEVAVETRTRELKETQAEQMTQLYRFAEFGRISSGLFHDLINPLNAVSLNIEKLKSQHVWLVRDSGKPNISLDETSGYLERAVSAARRLENMVTAVRKQLAREETRTLFLIEDEIRQVIDVLAHKAQKANVELRFMPRDDIKTLKIFGDAVKFNQVMLNLIANGIDACMSVKAITINRWVQVSLVEESEVIIIGVEDNGVGISEYHIDKIFEPFFTTKATRQGIGIGLSVTKRIVEQNFSGTISVESIEGKESVFTVKFPQKQNE